jgi:2,3-dihydroxyphenylpropionate 1,2-dioxygenase
MNTNFDDVGDRAAAEGFRAALEEAANRFRAYRPDVVVCLGSNHFRGIYLDLMPQFTVGVGEVIGTGESLTPSGPLPTDPPFARQLLSSLVESGFDAAFSLRLPVDHGVTHSLQHIIPELDVPVVPIIMNAWAPPLPSLTRCADLGHALARAVKDAPGDHRVAIIASGGLSHQLPFPKWYEASSDDDRFLVDAWLNGGRDWNRYEGRRREIVLQSDSQIREAFDRDFLRSLVGGRLSDYAELPLEELDRRGGNGAQEVRAWIAGAAAVGNAPAEVLGYLADRRMEDRHGGGGHRPTGRMKAQWPCEPGQNTSRAFEMIEKCGSAVNA